MNPVETEMLAYITRRLSEGATSVPASEVMEAVVPKDHPEYRYRPAYQHGLDRLWRRRQIHAIKGKDGQFRYYLDLDNPPWQDSADHAETDPN